MKKNTKRLIAVLALAAVVLTLICTGFIAYASEANTDAAVSDVQASEEENGDSSVISTKALAAGIAIAVAASVGAISMGFAISKSNDSISRQPEAKGDIRSSLMLGLVFIETAIIYALIVAILIIFVL